MLVYEVKQFARWASSCHAFCRWIYTKHAHIQSIQLSSKSSSLPAVMGCLPWKVGIKEWVGQLRCFFHLCFLHPVHHRKRNFLRLPFIPSDYPQRLITSALPLRSRETQLFFYVGLPYKFFFFPPTWTESPTTSLRMINQGLLFRTPDSILPSHSVYNPQS